MNPRDIQQFRQRHSLTQRALADLLGTTESTVSRLERQTAILDTRWSSHLRLLFDKLEDQRVAAWRAINEKK